MDPVKTFIALDLETTGLSSERDRIVEIGAVRFDAEGRELATFERLVNPKRPMPSAAFAVHRISDSDLCDQPGAEVVLPEFLDWIGPTDEITFLAHNASFDAGFLGAELARLGRSQPQIVIVDTLALSRKVRPDLFSHRLDVMARVYGLDPDGPHRALADARRVMGLWRALTAGSATAQAVVAYAPATARNSPAIPAGWDALALAMARGLRVRIEYAGGTNGTTPREITPRRFAHQGGIAYVEAVCHLSASEKKFRLDRVLRFEVVG